MSVYADKVHGLCEYRKSHNRESSVGEKKEKVQAEGENRVREEGHQGGKTQAYARL